MIDQETILEMFNLRLAEVPISPVAVLRLFLWKDPGEMNETAVDIDMLSGCVR
jgi:hypothetical protein